ncbi:hypothetical protein Pcinc_005813 [Petrolisthes cinctipes]|uniref:Uncharacterized protein n=1 Tax=Petrolisthes cinctipes TaxID=88211 RepID=A0AAE1GEI6_PETCI|nr:hypothetical protein Pcinc_005813 [Petrolisthes cinctipes]
MREVGLDGGKERREVGMDEGKERREVGMDEGKERREVGMDEGKERREVGLDGGRERRGKELYRLCTFQILIENQLVRRLAEKDYSAGIEGYWYQYFKRACSMKEMIIHQK